MFFLYLLYHLSKMPILYKNDGKCEKYKNSQNPARKQSDYHGFFIINYVL